MTEGEFSGKGNSPLVIHVSHPARRHGGCLFLGALGDHRLCGDEQPADRAGILESDPHDFCGIEDARRDQGGELATREAAV